MTPAGIARRLDLAGSTLAGSGAARSPRAPIVKAERAKAVPGNDDVTAQTVEWMADYIRESVRDPKVKAAAEYARRHFGRGADSPAAKVWAVFWYVKHCVKLRLDEGTMQLVGERNQQDLLISPAVLVRLRNPAEDCDGFSMLTAAMLEILGVPSVIVTVAADSTDKRRWSHVFVCAIVADGLIPLDTSHGKGPGTRWMVPAGQIYRWQAWDLDGRPVERGMRFSGLHGYVRAARRGMGAVCGPGQVDAGGDVGCVDIGVTTSGDPLTLPFSYVLNGTAPAAGSGTISDWTKFSQQLALGGEGIMAKLLAPPAYTQQVYNPATGQYSTVTVAAGGGGAPAASFMGSLGSLSSPVVLIGLGLLAVFALMPKRGGR